MATVVEVPGLGAVEFPDGMSDEDIAKAIKKNTMLGKGDAKPRPMTGPGSTGADVVTQIGLGIPRALQNVMNLPQNLGAMGDQAVAGGINALNKQFGWTLPTPPEKAKIPMLGDYAIGGLEKLTGPLPKPETTAGRYAGAASEGALSMGPIGGGIQGLLSGLGMGAGGEAGHDLSGGAWWGRPAGSLAGGVLPNVPGMVRNIANSRVGDVMKDIPESDIQRAIALQEEARRQGIALTGPEALGNRNLLSMQRVTENAPNTSTQLQQFMAPRAEQVTNAVNQNLSAIGPRVNPMATGVLNQEAAIEAVNRARQAGNAAARPFYQAAEGQRIPSLEWNALTQEPGIQKALQAVKGDFKYGISALEPEGSVKWLDAARKWLSDQAQTATQKGAPAAARVPSTLAQDINASVDRTIPDYRTARGIVQTNTRNVVEPMEQGIVGKAAATPDLPAQFAALTNRQTARPDMIGRAAQDIKGVNPTAYRDLIRTGIENEFDTAMKTVGQVGQEFGGAKFAKALRATPQTTENITAALSELPNGAIRVQAFNKTLDVLEATGNRLPTGSATTFNQMMAEELTGYGAAKIATNPVIGIGTLYDRVTARMNTKRLADAFTNPESVKLMKQLSMENPSSARARALVASILSAGEANDK